MKFSFLCKLVLALVLLLSVANTALAGTIDWNKRLEKGRYELSIGNVDKAIDIFSSHVKHHPEAGAPHTELGKAFKRNGNLTGAKSEFRRATEVEPSYADAHYELGAVEENDQQWALAAREFERYLQLDPSSSRQAAVSERLANCKQHL